MSVFTGIHHASLIVADVERALRFYVGVLQIPLGERPALGFPGAWLQVGEQQIHLLQLSNPDPVDGRPEHAGRDRHTALRVQGLGTIEQRLVEAGIEFTRSRSGRLALFCRDPDGNGIELIETG